MITIPTLDLAEEHIRDLRDVAAKVDAAAHARRCHPGTWRRTIRRALTMATMARDWLRHRQPSRVAGCLACS